MSLDPPSYRAEQLIRRLGQRRRRLMKRCFMNGKQCIFSAQLAEGAPAAISLDDLQVFVMMPFRPNLQTFYEWSLRGLLTDGYGLRPENVVRADEVRDLGHIVCEKVCRVIQSADFIIADISLPNANVFYELGLAYGLERPIILCWDTNEAKRPDNTLSDDRVRECLDLKRSERIIEYPGVGLLDAQDHRLEDALWFPPTVVPSPQGSDIKVSVLRTEEETNGGSADARGNDIAVAFHDVLCGAVGVALRDVRMPAGTTGPAPEEWPTKSLDAVGNDTFSAIANELASSFCTLIDVTQHNIVAYFWLGFCHARGLNAVPVCIEGSGDTDGSTSEGGRTAHAELAFDIRSQWYAEYDEHYPYRFAGKLTSIMQHLVDRDLPYRHKRAFWDRFSPSKKLKVFTGAIRFDQLNREMVGDWDVRAVSELFSYLPSIRESMGVELVTPLYSPESAYQRLSEGSRGCSPDGQVPDDQTHDAQTPDDRTPGDFITDYREHIEGQLANAHAIVIASADVNPVTEYLLHKLYEVTDPEHPFERTDAPQFFGYVVLKRGPCGPAPTEGGITAAVQRLEESEPEADVRFGRLFFRQEQVQDGEKPMRGFRFRASDAYVANPEYMAAYYSQDETPDGGEGTSEETFSLYGHLVVARYPHGATRGQEPTFVVLLNGVSGPATFALAQALTGGKSGLLREDISTEVPRGQVVPDEARADQMRQAGSADDLFDANLASEDLLERISALLDDPNVRGVEAIVEVKIGLGKRTGVSFGDRRVVKSWHVKDVHAIGQVPAPSARTTKAQ